MDEDTIRQLAARREGPALDFKEDFYPNSQDGSAELAKDVMAMANGLRRDGPPGYILIGVAEEPASKTGVLCGFQPAPWITNASLQQKVRPHLNRLPKFSWALVEVDGMSIGVLEVRHGGRPFFALHDKYNLKRHIALVRPGSTTDIASPDEIVQWYVEDETSRFKDLEAERLHLELMVLPRLLYASGSLQGTRRVMCYTLHNDGRSPFDVTKATCTWRLAESEWQMTAQRLGQKSVPEIPRLVLDVGLSFRTVAVSGVDSLYVVTELEQLVAHFYRHVAIALGQSETAPLPVDLIELMIAELSVECTSPTGRTETVTAGFSWRSEKPAPG